MLEGLAPVIDANTRLLVLGSFPGQVSLQTQRYYAHAQNHFWKILAAIWNQPLNEMPYEDRLHVLRQHGLGLWDVYARCERQGSLDSAIRDATLNDLAGLGARCPRLLAVAHNGGESYRHARHTQALGVPVYRLPSTSAANASWTFERKRAAWHEVFHRHGVTA